MKYISTIFRMANKDWTSRIFTFVLILLGTYSAKTIFKAKGKPEDCGVCISQLKEVNETIKLILSDGNPISAAYIDTVVKPMTGGQKIEALKRLSLKLDSLLKQDSLNKQKSKT